MCVLFIRQTCVLKMCPISNKKFRSQKSNQRDASNEIYDSVQKSSEQNTMVETELADDPIEVEENATVAEVNKNLETQEIPIPIAKLYHCSKCGKSFSKKYYAAVHCKPKKPWRCPHCTEEIAQKRNIKRHLALCHKKKSKKPQLSVTNNSFSCDVCDKSFLYNWSMTRHKQKQHGVDAKTLECESSECAFATNSMEQMKRHKTIYHGMGPTFNCDMCDSKLSSEIGLRKHKQTAHRFICDECRDSFANAKKLRMHKALFHARASQLQDNNANTETAMVYVTREIGEHSVHVYNNSSDKR